MSTKKKEIDYIENWDDYFLTVAESVARKSKDPNCQVGAIIVSNDNVILSTGFNGLARGVYDDEQLLANVDEKLKLICHAEMNAILNAARTGVSLSETKIYVNKFPCLSCCNGIVQSGIVRVCTHDDSYWDDDPLDPEHDRKPNVLKQAGVQVFAPFHPDFTPSEPVRWLKELRRRKSKAAFPRAKKTPPKSSANSKKRRGQNGGAKRI